MHTHANSTVQTPAPIAAADRSLSGPDTLQEKPEGLYLHSLEALSLSAGDGTIQRKLSVGSPDDELEQEANTMADTVMRKAQTPFIQTKCADCEKEEQVQAKPLTPFIQKKGNNTATASDAVSSQIQASRGNGSPLPDTTKSFMENSFGTDFSGVKIHTDSQAADLSQQLNAQAFTVGNDIYFNQGKYNPQSEAGQHLLAHELTHTLQQSGTEAIQRQVASSGSTTTDAVVEGEGDRSTPDASVSDASVVADPVAGMSTPPPPLEPPRPSYSSFDEAIRQASERYPSMAPYLNQITLRATVQSDRTVVEIIEGSHIQTYTYPSQTIRSQAGYYAYHWTDTGDYTRTGIVDLQSGTIPTGDAMPAVHQLAGREELQQLRRNRIGIIHFTQNVTPARRSAGGFRDPDSIRFPLPSPHGMELSPEDFRQINQSLGPPRPLTILGITGGIFEPNRSYGQPLHFKLYNHDGMNVLVSREMVGREFFYMTTVGDIQDFLRFYPLEYAGTSAAVWIPISRILFDVGISFVPIIGPLYMLAQAGIAVHHAYHHWDEMSGWEKGLVGVTVLLSVVPAVRAGRSIVRGATAYSEGVSSLVNAGLPANEARRLMLAAGVFQSERATLRIVDSLGDALRRGERLTAAELNSMRDVFQLMLQRLPVAERTAIAASFAATNLQTATEFFEGLVLTEQHLVGLRRLMPEVLVILRREAASNAVQVERIISWASRSEDIARGIDSLYAVLGTRARSQLTTLVSQAGEDVLIELGRSGLQISEELALFVRRARSASDAYRRLMQGTTQGGRNIAGLATLLSHARPEELSDALRAVQQQFSRTFLTTSQLAGLRQLNADVMAILGRATEEELRTLATAAGESSHAASAINRLGTQLLPRLRNPQTFAQIVSGIELPLLREIGRSSLTISDELLTRIASQTRTSVIEQMLLHGYRRGAVQLPGLLDSIASSLTTVDAARNVLSAIRSARVGADLFSRWAVSQQTMIRTILPEFADGIATIMRVHAQGVEKIAGIYRSLGGHQQHIIDFITAIGGVERTYGTSVVNLDRLISELAAGGTKTMGASLTLTYITRRNIGALTGFEIAATAGTRSRVYDVVAHTTSYEFKFWTGFGGNPAVAAADEFARDVMIHAQSNFANLRWVISRDAISAMPAIESMMRGVLSRRTVRQALESQGLVIADVQASLDRALAGHLIEFF